MYRPYFDLREKLGEPLWHDDQGVPRYVPYKPEHGGVYDHFSALLEIRCQACQQPFLVAASWDTRDAMEALRVSHREDQPTDPDVMKPVLPTAESAGSFGYGDAPWHGDRQCGGTTMSTDVFRVVEFWTRMVDDNFEGSGNPDDFDWKRRPEFEFTYPEGA